jgi:two-component system, cell cycle sensor histidine kinase and response regulator CckA
VDVNERMVQLTGRTRDEMLDGADAAAPVWSAPHLVDEWVAALQRGEPVRDRETEVRQQNGNLRQVLVSLSIVTLSGQPHMLVVAQDVTERTLLERQLQQAQKMETVGQLAAGLAHDFNNILTVIQGHAGLIKSQPDSVPGVAESADEIKQAVDRASELIRQLLMFSRKQVMQFGPLELNECVGDSRLMIARLVGEHIRIDFNPGASVPSIHADRAMIEQVIMNIAVNARDAMPDGGCLTIATGTVELDRGSTAADPETRRGRFVQLTFRDTGAGMPPHVLKRVFEPFFTTKEAGKGSGLGLSIVLGIVRQHRGWVEVDSQPGQGSEFRLHFPASEQQVEQRAAAAAAPSVPTRGHETVLVVEDQTAVRGMISRFLTAQGYKVITAASGVEALGIYQQTTKRVDLLLTDVVMPGGVMGGELARRLRAASPGLKVIFISGYNSEMAGKDLSLLGERNFLSKPFTIGELGKIVRQVLDQPPPAS